MRTPTPEIFRTGILAVLAVILLFRPNLQVSSAGQKRDDAPAARADQAASTKPAGSAEHAATTEKDQVDIAVTVYNSNLALVRDVRQIHLPTGSFLLWFEDVAASINPATVHFRSLNDPGKLNVIEQNYEYDLLDPQKLLQNMSAAK